MSNFKIFIIEDNIFYAKLIKHHLSLNPDNEIHIFGNANDCLANLHLNPNLITVDYQLPDSTGEELFKQIQIYNNQIPVIIISCQKEIQIALNFLKQGVYDYIIKNDEMKELLFENIIKIKEDLAIKNNKNIEVIIENEFTNDIIGQSEKLKLLFTLIEKASKSNINVSISGQTGTGKELVAKSIHLNSKRNKKQFIAVNMAAISKELVESELFGHEKGAFTGASERKKGKFEEANGGTLFLDEIGELDLNIQSKLLRVLQEREITRVGGNKVVKFDIKLIVATNKDLLLEVQEGRFREDLYYRILGLSINLPTLKERQGDILILANYFIEKYSLENKTPIKSFTQEANTKLLSYNYPGNIRELKSIIQLACVMSENIEITSNDLVFNNLSKNQNLITNINTLKIITEKIILERLELFNNNVSDTSKSLDIGKTTIYNLIRLNL
jgi:DNA-binding NtrC family response regulator